MPKLKAGLQTHCKYGHEFTEENTHSYTSGWRQCKACWARKDKERSERAKAKKDRIRSPKGRLSAELWAQWVEKPDTSYKRALLEAKWLFDLWTKEQKENPRKTHPKIRCGREDQEW